METTVQGPGILSCWLKVSTDLDQPLLKFLLDGVLQYSISGEGTGDGTLEEGHWQLVTLNIGSGTHTARWWWYEQFGPDELNLGWVDQVSLQSLSNAPTRITDATRLSDGKFQFTIDGPAGAAYGIEACSDLKSWLPIGQFVATNGVVTFTHQTAANFPVHYYRAVVVLPP